MLEGTKSMVRIDEGDSEVLTSSYEINKSHGGNNTPLRTESIPLS